jgi:hypothetical protein
MYVSEEVEVEIEVCGGLNSSCLRRMSSDTILSTEP